MIPAKFIWLIRAAPILELIDSLRLMSLLKSKSCHEGILCDLEESF